MACGLIIITEHNSSDAHIYFTCIYAQKNDSLAANRRESGVFGNLLALDPLMHIIEEHRRLKLS